MPRVLLTVLLLTLLGLAPAAQAAPAGELPDFAADPAVQAARDALDGAVAEETLFGCMEEAPERDGQLFFCGASKERIQALEKELTDAVLAAQIRSPQELEAVVASITALADQPVETLRFEGSSKNPYNRSDLRLEFYTDQRGVDYWVDPRTNQVVNMDFSKTGLRVDREQRLPRRELKQIGVAFLRRHVDGFETLRQQLSHRVLDCRDGDAVCAFRWERSPWPGDGETAPFFQVSVAVSGEIVGFANTLSLYPAP